MHIQRDLPRFRIWWGRDPTIDADRRAVAGVLFPYPEQIEGELIRALPECEDVQSMTAMLFDGHLPFRYDAELITQTHVCEEEW